MNTAKYSDGNIITLTLEDFQIFSNQTFHFEPSLNLIAAPNGSGKSSIANAIAFVFNGNCKTIGKSKELAEFIRFGQSSATITAVVAWKSGTVTLSRTVALGTRLSRYAEMSAAVSTFFIDGQLVNQKEYAKYIKDMGIDISNMCMFLPQERVAEFCTMDPAALLGVALGSTALSLDPLYAIDKDIADIDGLITSKAKKRGLVEDTLSRMEDGLREVREREEKELLQDRLVYKRDRIECDTLSYEYIRLKEELGRQKAAVTTYAEEMEKLSSTVAEIKADPALAEYNEKLELLNSQNSRIREVVDRIKQRAHTSELVKVEQTAVLAALEKKTEEWTAAERTKARLTDGLAEMEQAHASMVEGMKSKLSKRFGNMKGVIECARNYKELVRIVNEVDTMDTAWQSVNDRIRAVQYEARGVQNEIAELEQSKISYTEHSAQRLELLKKYHMDTYKAILWLRENKRLCAGEAAECTVFEDEILEPAFLHISIKPEFSQEIETLLSYQSLSSFLVKNRRDFVKLSRVLKETMKLGVNIAETVSADARLEQVDLAQIKAYKCDGRAIDFIEAHDEYKRVLCVYSHLGIIPVAKGRVDEVAIFKNVPRVKKLIADGQYVEYRTSRYSNDTMLCSNRVTSKGIFIAPKVDIDETNARLGALKAERERCREELDGLLRERAEIKSQNENFRKDFDMQEMQTKEYGIENTREKIRQIERSSVELTASAGNLGEKIDAISGHIAEIEIEIGRAAEELERLLSKKEVPKFKLGLIKRARMDLENAQKGLRLAELNHEAAAKECEELRLGLAGQKEKVRAAKAAVRAKEAELHVLYKERCGDAFKELGDLPTAIEEIQDRIRVVGAQLELMGNRGRVIEEFNSKEAQRRDLNASIDELQRQQGELQERADSLKSELTSQISKFISPISQRFSEMMARLGFSGELELVNKDVWELRILVSFREGEGLQQLSMHRQSGGEKSLSTVLFLLALQQCESVPFRLVDEINQGMDANNERAVFAILREMSALSQFFIITPKLIDGLEFSNETNAIILCSGAGLSNSVANKLISYLN